MSKYRFLLINAFSLAPGSDFQMRSSPAQRRRRSTITRT